MTWHDDSGSIDDFRTTRTGPMHMTRLYAFKTVRHENYVNLHDQRQQISTTTLLSMLWMTNLCDNFFFGQYLSYCLPFPTLFYQPCSTIFYFSDSLYLLIGILQSGRGKRKHCPIHFCPNQRSFAGHPFFFVLCPFCFVFFPDLIWYDWSDLIVMSFLCPLHDVHALYVLICLFPCFVPFPIPFWFLNIVPKSFIGSCMASLSHPVVWFGCI